MLYSRNGMPIFTSYVACKCWNVKHYLNLLFLKDNGRKETIENTTMKNDSENLSLFVLFTKIYIAM